MPKNITNTTFDFGGYTIHHYCGVNIPISSLVAQYNPDVDLFIVFTDSYIQSLYLDFFHSLRKDIGRCEFVVIPQGEQSKSAKNYIQLTQQCISLGATRRTCIVSCGGGVVENLSGMIAATLYRGIKLIHIPTTFIAMHDVSISIKQAVNLDQGKNLIGSFHAPSQVYMDLSFVKTLSSRDYLSGLGELLKTLLFTSPENLSYVNDNFAQLVAREPPLLLKLILSAIGAKKYLIESDPFEKGNAIVLEYGHTLGHALEAVEMRRRSPTPLSHGEAVSIGMHFAAILSEEIGLAEPGYLGYQLDLIKKLGLPYEIPTGIRADDLMAAIRFDNKRGHIICDDKMLPMVILSNCFKPLFTSGKPLLPIPLSQIDDLIGRLCKK